MGRKRKNENPVSLFAFQDIITSITGIMVLIVLLIILDVISHKEASDPKALQESQGDIKKLEEMAAGLKKQLDEGKLWLTKNEELIKKALSVNLDALPKMIKREEKQHLRLSKALEQLKNRNSTLKSLILKTEKDSENIKFMSSESAERIKKLKEELKKKHELLKTLTAKIEEAEKEKEKMKNRVEIRTTDLLNKTPVFVECSAAGIKTKIIKKGADIHNIPGTVQNRKKLISDFFKWLEKTLNPEGESIVLIVKPSSAEYIEELCAMLEETGFEYNLEPMQEDKTGIYK